MRTLFTVCLVAIFASTASGQKAKDLEAIKNLCGCFEVDFKYAETFSPIPDYEFKDRYTAKAVELALPIELVDDKVVIQHLLVINDSMVIKHWREDWLYENEDLLVFEGDSKWSKAQAPSSELAGTWTQKVYGTNDEPRYEGLATWTHVDGNSQWYNVSASPLPRREYTKRSDYNIMVRGNRIIIDENGYTHEQDNDKVKREGEERSLIASEKGFNIYTKTDASKCKAAEDWWAKNSDFWGDVRLGWTKALDSYPTTFELKQFSRTKMLYESLAELKEKDLSQEDNIKRTERLLAGYLAAPSVETVGK